MVNPPTRDADEGAEIHGRAPSISDRDAEVIHRIEQEGLTVFTFDGIRRLTGAHPETLSRIMGRLEEQGVIVRDPEGYAMSERARGQMTMGPAYLGGAHIPLLHTMLPYDVEPSRFVQSLKGRWFDRLRWVGISQGEDEATLKWVTEDGAAQIDARFARGQLDIEARVRDGADISTVVKAAHQLMSRVSRLYSATRPRSRLMFTLATGSRRGPAAM